MRRIAKVLCLSALSLLIVAPSWAETLQSAPLNPAFVEYLQQATEAKASNQSSFPTGRTPSPVDLSHLAGQSIVPDTGAKAATTYPAAYDLRDEGFVSPVRNQNPYGDCWTFSAMASMESTAMKLSGVDSLDLSEWHLTYYGYIDESDFLVGFGDYTESQFPTPVANKGGDDFRATAILSRWTGPALESAVPFGKTPFPTDAAAAYHLSDVMFLYYDQDTGYAPVSIENVKYALMNYGVVSVGVHANAGLEEGLYYNAATFASYIPSYNLYNLGVGDADHAVAIVGWDDTFPASSFLYTPPGDGAWIVRNSWGSDWGDGGYFYLSYYDAVLDTGAAYISAPADNYDHIYQHDPLGLVEMEGIPGDYTPSEAWMANVFTATGVQALKAVSFYAATVDTTYEIYVFTDVDADDPASGNLALYGQSGTLHVPGYRTVELDTPVYLTEDQTFSVVIKINTPGYSYPLALEGRIEEYSDKATANPGESFFSNDGCSWTDTTDVEATANLCIKAFTNTTASITTPTIKEEPSPEDLSLFQQSEENLADELAALGLEASMDTVQFLTPTTSPEESMDLFPFAYPYSADEAGTVWTYTICVARNRTTGQYEIPDENASGKTATEATNYVLLKDGGSFDMDGQKDSKVSSPDLAILTVQATVGGTSSSGDGGGCSAGLFAPAALLLLAPLSLLRKK